MTTTTVSGNTVVTSGVVQYVGPDVQIGDVGGTVSFFGKAPVAQATSASITDYATLKLYLQSIGLIGA